jgi:hypothetical protein
MEGHGAKLKGDSHMEPTQGEPPGSSPLQLVLVVVRREAGPVGP